MFKHYFKIGLRGLIRNKVFSIINIFGLTISLTSFLLISLYVFDEVTYDSFHKNADNIYRIIDTKTTVEGKRTKTAGAGYQISGRAKTDFPEVKNVVRIANLGRTNVSTVENSNVFYEDFKICSADFFKVFDFALLYGEKVTALTEPFSVIITQETARRLFQTTDVIGKIIKSDRLSMPFKVTAVLKDLPSNSHLSFNLLFSESSMLNFICLKNENYF